jgi:hypothetical protein
MLRFEPLGAKRVEDSEGITFESVFFNERTIDQTKLITYINYNIMQNTGINISINCCFRVDGTDHQSQPIVTLNSFLLTHHFEVLYIYVVRYRYLLIHHFAGASCLHWTTNNTTNYTRVSLDFRIIAGTIYNTISNSGEMYRTSFYSACEKQNDHWVRVRINENIPPPDKRTGFPWTVNDWDRYRKKK